MSNQPLSPALPPGVDQRPRRDSGSGQSITAATTTTAPPPVDREQLARALDMIHTSASQSDAFTTFNDFGPPPSSAPVAETRGGGATGDLVQQGLSGFYSRLKEAVVGSGGGSTSGKAAAAAAATTTTTLSIQSDTATADTPVVNSATAGTSLTHMRGKSSVSSLPRPGLADIMTTTTTTTSTASTDATGSVHAPPSSLSPASTPTTTTSQARPPIVGRAAPSAAVDTAMASGAVAYFKEPSRAAMQPGAVPAAMMSPSTDGPAASITTTATESQPGSGPGSGPGSVSTAILSPRLPPRLSHELKLPAVIDRLSVGGTSSGKRSPSVATDAGTGESLSVDTSAHNSVYHESASAASAAVDERTRRPASSHMRAAAATTTPTTDDGAPETVSVRLERMRHQVLSKDFWMADETCKECFRCGVAFTAFRRKHHCRTCGWIFDAKCTSTIPGQKFNVPGSLRVCKTCLDIINRRDDDNDSDDSDDAPRLTTILRSTAAVGARSRSEVENSIPEAGAGADGPRPTTTPMMAIPATWRKGDPSNRNSAILEIDAPPQLSRPSSSRSLKSLGAAARPTSAAGHAGHAGHVRHHSKHNNLYGDRVPFRKDVADEMMMMGGRKAKQLPAFHDDNIIDPELAPYMSDESSGDEQMSIFATMAGGNSASANAGDMAPPASSLDHDRATFGSFVSTGRKHRTRGEKSVSGLSFTSRQDKEEASASASRVQSGRLRNMSVASVHGPGTHQHHLRSPRTKGVSFKGPSLSSEALGLGSVPASGPTPGFGPGPVEPEVPASSSSSPPAPTKLTPQSLRHIKRLFRQLLDDAAVPHPAAWERTLIPLLRRCADDVDPNTREGDHMDIRHYVKLKKIPGGRPGDSSYVSGVIFTKNLALKSMPRRIAHPRILIVSFPIEYQRQQQYQFMSLEPVLSQEKEFLKLVVARIKHHRPEVVLAQRNVAGLALQSLADAGIAVAYNVKASVIGAVSRFVGTPIIASMDMLSLPIMVGRCAAFEVKTFVNRDILPGRKKTYIFLSGCEKVLGCTIALRGASTEVLARMKRITEFMVYVVYSLKLETCLLDDAFVEVGGGDGGGDVPGDVNVESVPDVAGDVPVSAAVDSVTSDTQRPAPARHAPQDVPAPTFYSDMVEKYKTKILSASPLVKFTQPYLLVRAREQETRLLYLKRLRDQDMIGGGEGGGDGGGDGNGDGENGDGENGENGDGGDNGNNNPPFQLINPEMVHEIGQKAPPQIMQVLHAVHDAEYDKALHAYQTMTRQWENYIQSNLDLFDPYSHQSIVVLYSLTCTETKIPCLEPGVIGIPYFNETPDPAGPMDADCTLGQYVQDLLDSADDLCHANGCDRRMWEHHRTYVHGQARVTFFVEPRAELPSAPVPSGLAAADDDFPPDDDMSSTSSSDDVIHIWSYCKVCARDLAVRRLSANAWKYSFGKYLELLFWGRGLRLVDAVGCPHDCQTDHIRYFHNRGASVRIHYDPIDLLEVVVPRARITWKVDHDLKLKNDIFQRTQERWTRFITSVMTRIKSIRIDSVLPDKEKDCRAEVERLAAKAHEENVQVVRGLEHAYMHSKHYEVIPLNATIRTMAEKIAEWDAAFAKFEADYLSDKDVRMMTMLQLRKMFEAKPEVEVEAEATAEAKPEPEPEPETTEAAAAEAKPEAEAAAAEAKPELDEKAAEAEAAGPEATGPETTGAPEGKTEAKTEAVADAAEAKPEVTVPAEVKPADSETVVEDAQPDAKPDAKPEAETATQPANLNSLASTIPPREQPKSPVFPPETASGLPLPTAASRSTSPSKTAQPSLTEKVEQLRREFKAQSTTTTATDGDAAPAQTPAKPSAPDSPSESQSSPPPPQDTPTLRRTITSHTYTKTPSRTAAADQRDLARRAGPTSAAPPIMRALSQPAGTVPRVLKKENKAAAAATSSVSSSSGTSSNTDSSTDAGKMEKKFADRIGLTALKNHRSKPGGGPAPTSSIPRFVHSKREAKKVTSLTQHFEQLSREFEKERNRERRKQAAKMQHHPRAFFPKSSARATVEVYDSVDQAVQEPGPTDDENLFALQQQQQQHSSSGGGGNSFVRTMAKQVDGAAGGVAAETEAEAEAKAEADAGVGADADAADTAPHVPVSKDAAEAAPGSNDQQAVAGAASVVSPDLGTGHDDAVAGAVPLEGSGTLPVQQNDTAEGPAGDGDGDGEPDEHKDKSAAGSDDEEGGSLADQDQDQALDDILPDVKIAEHLEPHGTVPTELQQAKKSNIMKMLSNFWAERSASGWPQLEYPLRPTDHIFIDSDVIVREDEPSSLIAFALSSEDYIAKLEDIRRQGRRAARSEGEDGGQGADGDGEAQADQGGDKEKEEMAGREAADEGDGDGDDALGMRSGKKTAHGRQPSASQIPVATSSSSEKAPPAVDTQAANVAAASQPAPSPAFAEIPVPLRLPQSSTAGSIPAARPPDADLAAPPLDLAAAPPLDEEELERSLLMPLGTHLKYQFTEGSARMMCKIFYAEQFDALRRKCGVADRIVESLSRCLKWDSKGGKTKSVFLKTLDDRLVMKSLSPVETAAFVRFAPSYFRIMAESLFHDLPSVIAKMLGFFQVIVKNAATGTEIKLDLLIMENLFYDRQETRKFDLKGSMRNRKIQSTGEQNEVLLDENMVEYIYESPLFAREHAKKLLWASVWNDTLFLARQNVMDYSLMVAVDESRKELVVGIIDCIRTYTWDKKLESWIKDRGFAGGGRNRPTVTSPKEYKSRFREAMDRYILQAPNCWHMFGSMGGYTHPSFGQRARFEDE